MNRATSNILVGGTSHLGKSTLFASLGLALNCEVLSTDKMARHPGRPWPQVRPHVAEFYRSLSADSIHMFLLHHHENMWPGLKKLMEERADAKRYCILEGSALRPEYLVEFSGSNNVLLCLHGPAELIRSRIHSGCNYNELTSESRSLVDVFIERSLRDNEAIIQAAKHHDIKLVDVADQRGLADLKNELVGDVISRK